MGAMPGYGGPGMGMPGMGVGGGDLEPPGMGPGLGGPFGPGLGGGGMQVGPDHPMFAGEPGWVAVLAVLCARCACFFGLQSCVGVCRPEVDVAGQLRCARWTCAQRGLRRRVLHCY